MKRIALFLSCLLATHASDAAPPKSSIAIFAGGCFWCMEGPFEKLPGVKAVTSGYTGGTTKNPTYEEVSSGTTGHAEAVEVIYDPAVTSYGQLLEIYWDNIDPTQVNGQFTDHGTQYRSAIFYQDAEQKRLAEQTKAELNRSHRYDQPVATEIVPASPFYPAEDYHQDYYKRNPVRYKAFHRLSGRDAYFKSHSRK